MTVILTLTHESPSTADVALVRRSVRAACATIGATALDDIELVVAELVANAVVHGAAPITVRATVIDDQLRLEVVDRGATPPIADGSPSADGERGRGLVVVAALATDWGWQLADDANGKTVWAALPLHADETATT